MIKKMRYKKIKKILNYLIRISRHNEEGFAKIKVIEPGDDLNLRFLITNVVRNYNLEFKPKTNKKVNISTNENTRQLDI